MQSNTIINLLRNAEISKFIGLHIDVDAKKLVLDAKKYKDFDIKVIATLINVYQKAKSKLPEHYKLKAALNLKSYEQCTSEKVAIFKSSIMGIENKTILNITGGIGVDDWAFSKKALQIFSCETDEEIHKLATYNIELFGLKNVNRILAEGIEFADKNNNYDIIYADPDRRTNNKKNFRLEDCQPEILKNLDKLLDKAKFLWIKVSPMADLTYLKRNIKEIKKIYVIALNGELKEILLCCKKKFENIPEIFAINIENDKVFEFKNPYQELKNTFCSEGIYLYEPSKSIVKAGLTKQYSSETNLNLISEKSNLYISNSKLENFQGKVFKIISREFYKPLDIISYFKQNHIKSANITTRNFYEKAEELWKRYKLKTGGNDYLYFTTDFCNQKLMYHCKKI
ncbi:MAG: hypothetical protein HUU47_07325 [Bacteroidetes bacterium]|nr:hypothetical protein [Bacteroidota bacterium]